MTPSELSEKKNLKLARSKNLWEKNSSNYYETRNEKYNGRPDSRDNNINESDDIIVFNSTPPLLNMGRQETLQNISDDCGKFACFCFLNL